MWSLKDNQYLIVESATALLVSKLSKGESLEDISRELSQELSLPIKESTDFVLDLKKRFIDIDSSSNSNKKEIIEEIQKDFDEAYIGIKNLPKEAKFGVYTAYKYYNKLLNKIVSSDIEAIKNNRIRVSNPMKFALLTKSYFDYKMNLI